MSGSNGQISQSEFVRQSLDRFEGPLLRYALRLTGDLEQARDVVQDTFLRLCRQEPGHVDGHLAQWLFTVCRNRALDVHRKERRMATVTELDDRVSSASQPAPDEAAEQKETTARVLKLLDRLPENQQEVIRLKFQNELSYQEIAAVTGLSISNVGFLLHVGLKRLRELMRVEPIIAPVGSRS